MRKPNRNRTVPWVALALVLAGAPAALAGYTPAGEFTAPTDPGSPAVAMDMEIGPQERPYLGTYFTSDVGTSEQTARNRVRGFDPDGTTAVTVISDGTFVGGFAVAGDGRIYLAEIGLVRVLSAAGVEERTFHVPVPGGDEYTDGIPTDLAIDASGRLYFLEQGEQDALRPAMVIVFENNGTFVRSFPVHDVTEERYLLARSLAVSASLAYVLWDGDEVRAFDLATGAQTATLFPADEDADDGIQVDRSLGQLAVASDLDLGPDGSLYVADCWTFQRVQRFTTGGQRRLAIRPSQPSRQASASSVPRRR